MVLGIFFPANNPCTSQHVLLSGKEEDRREKSLSLLCDSARNYHDDDEGWVLSTHVGLICVGHGMEFFVQCIRMYLSVSQCFNNLRNVTLSRVLLSFECVKFIEAREREREE